MTVNREAQPTGTPRVGLKIDDYVKWIKLQLGGTVVALECEEQIPEIVDMSFLELRNFITDIDTLTLPFQNCIDLSKYKVSSVHYVMRGSNNANGLRQLQDAMYLYINQSNWAMHSDYADRIANAMMISQNKSMISTDLDFHFDKRYNTLYVHAQQLTPSAITIAYTPEYEAVEDIYEPFWQDKLRRLALAHTKEILGRIRSKYAPTNATYQLDGATLLQEAQSELSDIRAFLDANGDTLFPMD